MGRAQPQTSTPANKGDGSSSSSESDESEDDKKASVKPLINGGGDALNGSLTVTPISKVNVNASLPVQVLMSDLLK